MRMAMSLWSGKHCHKHLKYRVPIILTNTSVRFCHFHFVNKVQRWGNFKGELKFEFDSGCIVNNHIYNIVWSIGHSFIKRNIWFYLFQKAYTLGSFQSILLISVSILHTLGSCCETRCYSIITNRWMVEELRSWRSLQDTDITHSSGRLQRLLKK